MNKIKSKKAYVNIGKKSINGITLISLVITIVIMLILAAVSINLILGDNGLFSKAKTSASKYSEAKIKEDIEHLVAEWNIQKEDDSQNGLADLTLYSFLQTKIPDEIISIKENTDSYEVKKDGYTIVLSKDGNINSMAITDPNAIEYIKWDGTVATNFESGTGNESDPYIISNPSELAYLANSTNSGTDYTNKYIKLNSDLDLDNISWAPIGNTLDKRFLGNFDGNNKSITNLIINKSDTDYIGLFGTTKLATIQNLKLVNGSIRGKNYIGSIVGYLDASYLLNCSNTSVTITATSYAGGVIGYAIDSLAYPYNPHGTHIDKCYNKANVTGTQVHIGGIAGQIGSGTLKVSNIYNEGTITGNQYVGGLAGYLDAYLIGIDFYNGYNIGEVSGNGYIGGCIGEAYMFTRSDVGIAMKAYLHINNLYNLNDKSCIYDTTIIYSGSYYSESDISYIYTRRNVSGINYYGNKIKNSYTPPRITKNANVKKETNRENMTIDDFNNQDLVNLLNEHKGENGCNWTLSNGHPVLIF